jgi:hypothetical protein
MLAKLFSIGDRNYLNNAVVIADALDNIIKIFGDVKNFKIQFRKPFLSQGEFTISTNKLEGYITGEFDTVDAHFYFSYYPIDMALENRIVSGKDIKDEVTSFNVCYYITDICRGVIERGFERAYGPMSEKDKVIFVIFEVPDTSIFSDIIKNQDMPPMHVTEAECTGDRRFKISVFVGGKLLGHRHSTVKEFIV